MIVLKLILITLLVSVSHSRTPDKVICVNINCDAPIAAAKTLLNYNSPDPDLLSFRPNSDALIYMKSAGTNADLWFVKINGKSGFANKRFLRETKVLARETVEVPFEKINGDLVKPDKVQQAHEVIEGTTIYTTEATVTEQTTAPPGTTEDPTKPLNSPLATKQNVQDVVTTNSNENPSGVNFVDNVSSNTEPAPVTEENSGEESVATPEESANASNKVNSELNQHVKESHLEASPTPPPTDTVTTSIPTSTEPTVMATEINDSVVNNSEENVQPIQEAKTDNVPEQNVNPVPVQDQLIPPIYTNIPAESDRNVLNNVNVAQGYPGPLPPEPEQFLPTVNPIDQPPTLPPVTTESIPVTTETVAPVPPITNQETIPPILNMQGVSTELPPPQNLPPLFEYTTPRPVEVNQYTPPPTPDNVYSSTQETSTQSVTEEPTTLPSTYPEETSTTSKSEEYTTTLPPYSYPTQSEETYTTPTPTSEEYTTTSPPYSYPTQSEETYTTPTPTSEEYSTQPEYTEETSQSSEDTSTTEAPTENSESIFSTVYSTVADLWPTTTEAPDTLYNTDSYPTYETEKQEQDQGFSLWKYGISTYYSIFGPSEETKAIFASVGETCFSDEYCDGTSNDGTNRLLTYLLTTASSVLLFTLGYYYIDNRRQDGRLIGTINSLQRDLLFSTKECEILKEELASTKSKLAGIEDNSFGMDDMVQSLKEEIDELKATNDRLRNSLDDNEKLLRVSENTASEMQTTLGEVENTLSELLAERASSEEQILELNGKIQAFEEELISVSRDRDHFQLKYVSAESASEDNKNSKKQLDEVNKDLADAKNTIELQRHELAALKEAIKELKSGSSSNFDAASLIDHTEIKAKLNKALEERKSLAAKFETEHKERSRLAEELKSTQASLQTSSQSATEAQTRLEVLGKYFQERESELMKELTAKESLWLSKQGESASTVEKIELLQQEVQRFKEKCDALTLELAEQESSRLAALSSLEARAHGAWLEARAARRDADAARGDAAALRRRLASLSAADGAVSPHHKISSPLEAVDGSVLPPPLPGMFLPPLLPPLPRPPPLGRLPSPHPPRYSDRRYSPDSRYSPESRYSPDSRYSPETVRYSPDSRYSPRRRPVYSPRSRRRSRSRERYPEVRATRSRNGPADTETEYNSDSPSRETRRRPRYSRHSGPSSGSGCSSESDK